MKQSSMVTFYPPPFLPAELLVEILSFTDQRILLIFEQVSKSVAGCVNVTWRTHKRLAGFKFSWSDCQKENCPEKWELILSRALIRYIDSQTSFDKNPKYDDDNNDELRSKAKLQQISLNYFKLKKLTKRFPSFGAYIRLDLAKSIYADGYYPVYRSYPKSNQNEAFEINKERHDSLMNHVLGICELPTNLQPYVSAYLLARFKQQQVRRKIFSNQIENYSDKSEKWAIEKKSNTLQKILSNPQNLSDFNRVPANLLNDLKQKNKICKIPSGHGGELLLRALFNISNKVEFCGKEELKKVNQYFLDAIKKQATYASQLAFNLIYYDTYLFNSSGDQMNDKTRALLYEPLAISSAKQEDFSSVVNLAYLKFEARKWTEAESLYEDYLEKVANKCIHGIDLLKILYALTVIKVKLKKCKEVEFSEIHTLLLKLNQAWENMINIDSVLVVYKKEMKDLSAEEFLKEFGQLFFHPKEGVNKMIRFEAFCFHPRVKLYATKTTKNFSRIGFLSDLLLAAQLSGKWKLEEIILAIRKNNWFSSNVYRKIQKLRTGEKFIEEMEKKRNEESQSTEKELQKPPSKRTRYN